LGQPRIVQELIRLVQKFGPSIVFVSEVRQNKTIIQSLCSHLGLKNCLPVCLDGKGGGLALYWKEDIQVCLVNFGVHHIDVKITKPDGLI
jgi:hypothetical protein